ncbi:hypothetical protein J6590_039798 [Homalodisca vitripennis]|nr:hypothetical protein J6590_039798 [Homalodisca vitripennis]
MSVFQDWIWSLESTRLLYQPNLDVALGLKCCRISGTQGKSCHFLSTRIGLRYEGLNNNDVTNDRFYSIIYLRLGYLDANCRISTQDALKVGAESELTPGGFTELDKMIAGSGIPEALYLGCSSHRVSPFDGFPPAHCARIYPPTA